MTSKSSTMESNFVTFVVIQLFLSAIISPRIISAEEVDSVDIVLSKNAPKNRTSSLPRGFKMTGDVDQLKGTDCCALALFFEVKDLEAQTESGQVTFTFYHPQIRNNPYTFTMNVQPNEGEKKVTTRSQIDFDNCNGINHYTIDINAKATFMDKKDVKIRMITGKDEGIDIKCTPIPITTLKPPTNSTTSPPDPNPALVIGLIIGWSLFLLIFVVCISTCIIYKIPQDLYKKFSNKAEQDMELHERATPPPYGQQSDSLLSDPNPIPPTNVNAENVRKGGKQPRSTHRSPPKEEETHSNEKNGLLEQLAYFAMLIKDNPPVLVASIAAGLFFVASVIATIICVFLFP